MRRNWFVAAIVLGLVAIVVAALAARLTGDDSSDVDTWASSVCTSVSDWREAITALADVEGELNAETLDQKIDDAQAATDELVSELRDLGPPDLQSGDALKTEVDALAESLRAEYEALKVDAQAALAAGSPSEFVAALGTLAPRYERLLTGAAAVPDRLETASSVVADDRAELQRAFRDAASCQELRSAAGG